MDPEETRQKALQTQRRWLDSLKTEQANLRKARRRRMRGQEGSRWATKAPLEQRHEASRKRAKSAKGSRRTNR